MPQLGAQGGSKGEGFPRTGLLDQSVTVLHQEALGDKVEESGEWGGSGRVEVDSKQYYMYNICLLMRLIRIRFRTRKE